ncbi:DUF1295 domain-containing protein [Candidatus Woesearchaeota archaeon]|nr:DUF1295 domain-containing protein [Candidatus Woesearchaeota archaeon]
MNELLLTFLISLGIQIVLFIPAFIFRTDKLTDLSYGLTFILLAWIVFLKNSFSPLKLLLVIMITLWGMRLAGYLVIRILKTKKDKRFDGIRESFPRFFSFWVLQGVSVWIIMLSTLLFLNNTTVYSGLTLIGIIVWIIGISIEATADQQKYAFKSKPENKGKWISSGLWKYSRHPNYFGEISCWLGIYLLTFSSLPGIYKLLALASPLYIAFILIFVTGLPKLEKYADEKWGGNKDYQAYKRRTSILIILPPRNS